MFVTCYLLPVIGSVLLMYMRALRTGFCYGNLIFLVGFWMDGWMDWNWDGRVKKVKKVEMKRKGMKRKEKQRKGFKNETIMEVCIGSKVE